MFKIGAKVEGTQELARACATLSRGVSTKMLIQALMEGAELLSATMSDLAPRAPGKPDLADNIVAAPLRGRERGSDQAAVGIGPSSTFFFYDLFQEFGTVRNQAQPFYRPALDTQGQQALFAILSAIRRELLERGAIASARSAAAGSLR